MRFPDDVPVLTDGIVTLRAPPLADVGGVLEQCTDPVSQRWTTVPVPYTREDAQRFVRRDRAGAAGARAAGRSRSRRSTSWPIPAGTALLRHRRAARRGQPAGRDRVRRAPVGARPRHHRAGVAAAARVGLPRAAAAHRDLVGERRQLGVAAHGLEARVLLRRRLGPLAAAARRPARRMGRGAARRRRAGAARRVADRASAPRRPRGAARAARRRRRADRRGVRRRADGALAVEAAIPSRTRPTTPTTSCPMRTERLACGEAVTWAMADPAADLTSSGRSTCSTSSRGARRRSATGPTPRPGVAG